jgi:excisionase family DNA binding protein
MTPRTIANAATNQRTRAEMKTMQAVLEIPELVGQRNLRVGEAATVLGIGRSKLYELIASGRLRSVKIDSARRVPVAALQEFLSHLNGGEVATL